MIETQLEQIVEEFERAQRAGQSPDIAAYAARVPVAERANIVVELIRSDIEFRWDNGLRSRDIETYRQEFPQVFANSDRLRDIAFEDCRQRLRHGHSVDSKQYAKRFGIDVSDWQFESTEPNFGAAAQALPADNPYVRAISNYFSDFVPVLELGRGAAGRVYLAAQGELAKRLVALKVTNEPNFEPLQLAQLQHSNIVPIYSVHRKGDWQAVCMPFMGHFTLGDLVKHSVGSDHKSQRGRDLLSTVSERTQETIRSQVSATSDPHQSASVTVQDAFSRAELRFVPDLNYVEMCIWLVSRIAAGLAHAHRRGIVHSDLKPSNILIGHDGEPLILDFHLAHRLQGERPNFIGGTLPYMSADHLRALDRGEAPNEECDLFSLGVILYQLLTGQLPYPERRGTVEEILPLMIVDRESPVARPSSLNPVVSSDIDAIVMKCLAQGTSPGYSAATELEADLRRHLEFLPPKYARSFAPREHFRKWMARHPAIRSAGFISLAFAAVAAVIFSWVAFRIQRDAKRLAENRFVNASRELNDANGTLASAGFGGASINEVITKSKSLLDQYEIPESAPPVWEDKLPAISRAELRRQLGEFHYLVASAHLQNLRGDSAIADPARELELANQHHQLSVEMFEEQQPPKVLQWQAELLREPDHAGKAPEWQRFATWAKAAGHELTQSAKWLDQRLLAIEYYRQGDFRSAAALLEAGLQDHATDYSSWLILGNAHAKARDFSKAEICYLVCQALRPKSADAYFNRGVARIDANLFGEAIADFNRCIELNRTAPEYFANRGLCYFNMGDLKSAESDLTQALELGATETRLYFFRSQVRRALGNTSGADEDQAVGLKSIPSDELSWISRGFYSVEENPQQAISDFQSAIRLNPRSANAWENCAAVYADKLQDLPKSIECMDELVRMEPKNPKHLASRGALFARMGNRDSALADAQAALQLSSSGETLYRVGSVFARLAETHPDDAEQATRLIRAAASKDPLFVVRYLGKDQDLQPILERPEFQELSERLDWLKTQPKSQ